MSRLELRRIFGSREAADAIYTCREIEHAQDALARDSADTAHPMREQILEWGRDNLTTARAGYTDALQTLKAAFPAIVCCAAFETGGCSHGKPCGCGLTKAPWPWIVQ